jgi:hypothetical protein
MSSVLAVSQVRMTDESSKSRSYQIRSGEHMTDPNDCINIMRMFKVIVGLDLLQIEKVFEWE